jgi:hypothetical protein
MILLPRWILCGGVQIGREGEERREGRGEERREGRGRRKEGRGKEKIEDVISNLSSGAPPHPQTRPPFPSHQKINSSRKHMHTLHDNNESAEIDLVTDIRKAARIPQTSQWIQNKPKKQQKNHLPFKHLPSGSNPRVRQAT